MDGNRGVVVKMSGDGASFRVRGSSRCTWSPRWSRNGMPADPVATNGVPLRVAVRKSTSGASERRDNDFGPAVNRAVSNHEHRARRPGVVVGGSGRFGTQNACLLRAHHADLAPRGCAICFECRTRSAKSSTPNCARKLPALRLRWRRRRTIRRSRQPRSSGVNARLPMPGRLLGATRLLTLLGAGA